MKMEHSVIIDRPLKEVFEYLADIEKQVEWRSGAVEAKKTSEGPLAVGSTGWEVLQFLGRKMEITFEVTDYQPDKLLAFRNTSGPMALRSRLTFEEVPGGTRVDFTIEGEPGGLFKLGGPILRRIARRRIEADCSNLKDLLEARGHG